MVGRIVMPLLLAVETGVSRPDRVSMTPWPALALVAVVLPRAKAVFLGVIWAAGSPGSARG